MYKHRTDMVIAELVEATCGPCEGSDDGVHAGRMRHVFREALHGLVRLAKVEQLMDMRVDAERAAGGMTSAAQRRQTKALLRKIGMDVHAGRRRIATGWVSARGGQPLTGAENDCGER